MSAFKRVLAGAKKGDALCLITLGYTFLFACCMAVGVGGIVGALIR